MLIAMILPSVVAGFLGLLIGEARAHARAVETVNAMPLCGASYQYEADEDGPDGGCERARR